jgi:hypothetical protein
MDEILREVRRVREELAARFGYDVAALHEHFKASQKRRGTPTVDLSRERKEREPVPVGELAAQDRP